jgi:hypothetical protein
MAKIKGSLTEGKGLISTVDPLVLTCLGQLLFKLRLSFTFFTEQPTSMRRSTVLSHLPQLVFSALVN